MAARWVASLAGQRAAQKAHHWVDSWVCPSVAGRAEWWAETKVHQKAVKSDPQWVEQRDDLWAA